MSTDRERMSGTGARLSRGGASWVVAGACALAFASLAQAQSFTRIATGPHVNDGGASRSVNWLDADQDGDLDLFVSNGPSPGQAAFYYLNDGAPNWTFTKVTTDPIVQDLGRSDGASFGDYDNDGDLDGVVSTWYGDVELVYAGDGSGGFTKVTAPPVATTGGFSESCSWGDYDGDHRLDLYVANSGNAFAEANFLYRNSVSGSFTRILAGAPATDAFRTRGVNWVDYDNDGDQDLFAVNEENQHENLYRNNGNATFTAVAGDPLVTAGGQSWTASWADIDDDGDLDVYVGNWGGQNDNLFLNDGDGTFTRILTGPVVTSAGLTACSGWGDYDNDGDLDLFTSNAYGGTPKTNFLFTNQLRQTGTLDFVKGEGFPLVTDTGWTYGFAWGDYDRDGDLDIFQARTFGDTENNALYRNDEASGNRWLTFHLNGTDSNAAAIGARVYVEALLGGVPVEQLRVVEGQSGYCGQNLELHFGLGAATVATTVRVEWPSGIVDLLPNVATNQHLVLTEGENTTSADPGEGRFRGTLLVTPNPFRDRAVFELALAEPTRLRLDLFDPNGRRVARLLDGHHEAGRITRAFQAPIELASGVVFYRLEHDHGVTRGRLVRQR